MKNILILAACSVLCACAQSGQATVNGQGNATTGASTFELNPNINLNQYQPGTNYNQGGNQQNQPSPPQTGDTEVQ